jgi:UDP-3-O-acyl N-acetylglucosamine deacetylase
VAPFFARLRFKEAAVVKRLLPRSQRTLARPVTVDGIGFITGQHVHLTFLPAPADTGVVFHRKDLGPSARIPANVELVTGTQRRTTLGTPPVCVTLVEHVLASLAGLHLDNCIVELDAPEPPGLDGSAAAFVDALLGAGEVVQDAPRDVWTPRETVIVSSGDATLALHPAESPGLRISYLLDYGPMSPIDRQSYSADITAETFAHEIATCRTFLLEEETKALLAQGIGKNSKVTDLVIFGPNGPIDNTLRFGNEPARHKTLDIIGDLALFGCDLAGHVVAYRSGHPLNVDMARLLRNVAGLSPRRSAAA